MVPPEALAGGFGAALVIGAAAGLYPAGQGGAHVADRGAAGGVICAGAPSRPPRLAAASLWCLRRALPLAQRTARARRPYGSTSPRRIA